MKEYKTINVETYLQDHWISFYSDFGWTLHSSQDVKNTDTDISVIGDTIYTTKTTEEYTKLVFVREQGRRVNSELDSLYYAWDDVPDNKYLKNKRVFWSVIFFIISAIAIIVGMALIAGPSHPDFKAEYGDNGAGFILAGLGVILGAALFIFLGIVIIISGKKKIAKQNLINAQNDEERARIRTKARAISSSLKY